MNKNILTILCNIYVFYVNDIVSNFVERFINTLA
jgi:hypothetical protein